MQQKPFAVQGGDTSRRSRRDGLAVVGVLHVAGGEDAFDRGLRRSRLDLDVAFGKTLEEAQALIEQIGREKGADAIVFEGVVSETSAPTYTTTEKIEKNDDGSKTRTATTSQSVFTTNRLLATFIKYKTQTN